MRRGLILLIVAVGGVPLIAALWSGTIGHRFPECPEPRVLAASSHLALSCIDTIRYDNRTYYLDCVFVHRTRIGQRFLRDGGETDFHGARAIVGIERHDAFLLEPGHACPGRRVLLAASDSFGRLQAGLLRVPTTAKHPVRTARSRAPWIVPGRRAVPRALIVDAELVDGLIQITNRNRFWWRECYQVQINVEDDNPDAIWEAPPFDSLAPGESFSYSASAFGRDMNGIEELDDDEATELRGTSLLVMCQAPRGPAYGKDPI